ncbi:MAG TPA: ATP-binding protein [Pseudomonadota bacterium]|nr:ATP-binding protein [Pseudomonadota bacterium]
MRQKERTLLLWLALIAMFAGAYSALSDKGHGPSLATFVSDAESAQVSSVQLEPDTDSADRVVLRVLRKDGRRYETSPIALTAAIESVQSGGIPYSLKPAGRIDTTFWLSLIPVLLIGFFVFYFVRSLKGLGSGKSPGVTDIVQARIEVQPPPSLAKPSFDSEPAQRFLASVQDFKDNKEGPRKLLLCGPPGSGKTTLVLNAAFASQLSYIALPASDVANMFVGIAAARIRRAFELAHEKAPCLLLIEDMDGMAARRTIPGEGKAAEEGQLTEQVQGMLELCAILDGVREFPSGVLFVATSNRPDRLDEALVRKGRIDLRIDLPAPP